MGINHATSGAAVWFAATATLPVLGTDLFPLDPAGVLVGAFVCAGAALLPDADHHSGTIAHSVPVLGRLAAEAVETASGGHRHGAHTLAAGALVTALAVLVGRFTTVVPVLGRVPVGPAIATVALICFALKARGLVKRWATAWLLGLAAAVAVLMLSPDTAVWFPVAVGLGFVTHIAGDLLTVEGVPNPLWPIQPKPPRAWDATPLLRDVWKRNGYISVPVLGHAGSVRETLLGIVLGLYCVYAFGTVALQASHVQLLLSL
ncbi:metal-dependent hydrolase [Amnibacterium sp. CER49]|uniref:metal-dependent hydrolase n=1 Tax=Amnibacterium sp. CER49 TaxID=3039161 RepID=UPI00244BAAF9|nr:metal-dependent hydrolase [Amnibacterium sp. CER49]MDH2443688.1 metal-dependent hydrolase [Amnibacterium sp. CER49]